VLIYISTVYFCIVIKYGIISLFLSVVSVSAAQSGQYLSIQKEQNDSLKCELLLDASEYYKFQNVDTLLLIADHLIKTAEKIKSNRFLETGYSIKSLGLKFKGDFSMATGFAQKALEINSRSENKINRAKILLNYADLLRQQKQYDVCEKYHREGIGIAKTEKDSALLARYYINTGLMFADMNKLDSAFHFYNQGISITDKFKDLRKIGITARLNLSALASKQKNYKEMIRLAHEVYKYGVQENDADHISLGAINVANGYVNLENYDKALEYCRYAEEAAIKYKSPQNLLFTLGTLSDIYAAKGDYKSALEKALSYIGLKDSLRTALYDQNLMEMTTKYELKEKENLLTQHQLTIQKQSSRQRLIIWLSAILILTGVLIFLYLKNRQDLQRKTAEVEAEKAQLQAQLEHAEVERLQEIDKLRSIFFANISHEFRTPLTLILNPTEQLLDNSIKTEDKKYLNIIYRNASRLLELVNQLLDISKLESGKTTLQAGRFDIKQFCLTLCGLFESLAAQKGIDFGIKVPEQEISGYFDKDVIEKIVVNLLSNAFKFTPSGGEISVSVAQKGKHEVEISIRDTGIGISQEQLAHLFERFMSFSGSDIQNNSGIGLSLVKELVELHKGDIKVESEIGVGSVFTVSINLDKNNYTELELLKENNSIPSGSAFLIPSLKGIETELIVQKRLPNISSEIKPLLLIAEDNPDVRLLITDICKDSYQIITAENGKSAYHIAIEKVPDIIITDIMMPVMDGNEFCALLRENGLTSHIPIIMLTARGDQKDKLIGLKTGADDYLTKPFNAEELLVRLHNLLEQRKKLREYYKKAFHAFTPVEENMESMDAVFLDNLKKTIEKNLQSETYGVSELASDLYLSRSQLHRKVTVLLGFSPNEVIRNMRLEKARMMILKKAGTIAEIAYSCGFNSAAYFSKCYKDYFGHTAGEEN